jgi:hypothetical protein
MRSLVKLPEDIDLTLFLIREELKSFKLYEDLRKVGFEECPYQSDFTTAIFKYAGFDDLTDDLLEFYVSLLTRHTETIEPGNVMNLSLTCTLI